MSNLAAKEALQFLICVQENNAFQVSFAPQEPASVQTSSRGPRVTALLRTTSGLSSELVPPFSALGSLAQASAATEEESWAETCTHMARFITEH